MRGIPFPRALLRAAASSASAGHRLADNSPSTLETDADHHLPAPALAPSHASSPLSAPLLLFFVLASLYLAERRWSAVSRLRGVLEGLVRRCRRAGRGEPSTAEAEKEALKASLMQGGRKSEEEAEAQSVERLQERFTALDETIQKRCARARA
jgi:biopolymer transport protein ExbB/TolQ